MRFSSIMILVLVIALAVTPAMARQGKYQHEGTTGMWNSDLFGHATIDNVNFNFKGNGSFDKENSAYFGWKYRVGGLSDVSFTYNKVENNGTINIPVSVNGSLYAAGAQVNIELTTLDILGYRELKSTPQGYLDFVYGLKMLDAKIKAAGTVGGIAASTNESYKFPLPQFGIAGEYWINPRWTFMGSFYGFSINRDSKGGTVKNMDAGFQYRFNPKHNVESDKVDWYAQLAWKAEYIRGKDNNDDVVIDHEGVRFGIVGKF